MKFRNPSRWSSRAARFGQQAGHHRSGTQPGNWNWNAGGMARVCARQPARPRKALPFARSTNSSDEMAGDDTTSSAIRPWPFSPVPECSGHLAALRLRQAEDLRAAGGPRLRDTRNTGQHTPKHSTQRSSWASTSAGDGRRRPQPRLARRSHAAARTHFSTAPTTAFLATAPSTGTVL